MSLTDTLAAFGLQTCIVCLNAELKKKAKMIKKLQLQVNQLTKKYAVRSLLKKMIKSVQEARPGLLIDIFKKIYICSRIT